MKQIIYLTALSALLAMQSGCLATRPGVSTGGLIGGTTGGLIGAAIGAHEGKSGEGALIGAVAGGLTGAALGNQADEANFRNQRMANQRMAEARQAAVTTDDVMRMSLSNVGDDLIINQVKAYGFAQRLTTNDLIQLKSQNVSDQVIDVLQSASQPTIVSTQPVLIAPRPICQEPYCPTARFSVPPIVHRIPHRHRDRVGIDFRF
jgi:hypothetical protein